MPTEIDWVALTAVALIFGGPLIAWVASEWRKVRIAEATLALKRDMIERGFTVEQVQLVVDAAPHTNAARR